MLPFHFNSLALLATIGALSWGGAATGAQPVDFEREIRPLFVARCLNCHGGVKTAGGLSLVDAPHAMRPADSGSKPIKPGAPDESELWRRITSTDPEERMPLHKSPLTATELDRVRTWIQEGAEWPRSWFYSAPTVSVETSVDALIQRAQGLLPSPPASPAILLRRVSLDLTGLPPTPAEFATFLAAPSDRAYQEAVDRLLTSPRFGERWASVWLDLARYADTQGYEKDNFRTIWAYRDWIIQAFNDDLPFDQFTIAQIAGDLLPHPTVDELTATAYHRNTMTNTEGGTDDEEFRVKAVIDRVNTTWMTWLGLNFNCAQCHDHPTEPITQRDYYRFLAFFNNSEDSDQDDDRPTISLLPLSQRRKEESIGRRLSELDAELKAQTEAWKSTVVSEQAEAPIAFKVEAAASAGARYEQRQAGSFRLTPPSPGATQLAITLQPIPGRLTAIQIAVEGADHSSLAILSHLDATLALPDGQARKLSFAEPSATAAEVGFPVEDAIGRATRNRHGWGVRIGPGDHAIAIFPLQDSVEIPAAARLVLKLDQSYEAVNGEKAAAFSSLTVALSSSPRWERQAHPPEQILKLRAEREEALAKREGLLETTVPVMRELPPAAARVTRLFRRGNWLDPQEIVSPDVPAFLPRLPADAPRNRLGLARWLVSAQNPLTARVFVNRIWAQLFGAGLVEVENGFSSRLAPPPQRGLLDGLAVKFQGEWRWSLKRLLREIVLSQAYRQSSDATAEARAADPENRWLARGPRFRLPAEMIRDQALSAAGLLSPQMYGPSVMPPQPEGVWQVVYSAQRWVTSPGENRHRRALYTFWRRTSPYPSLTLFDAPTRETCVTQRPSSDSPASALVLLNDPVYLEAASAVAQRMVKEGGAAPADRISYGWRLFFGASPSPANLKILLRLLEQAGGNRTEANDSAPYAAVATALLNLDATVTKE